MKYTPVIGLEVHVELKTKSKMFCGCSADYFGKEPNSHTCPVCLGLPGALPVPNKTAIDWCIMIGMALDCEIPLFSKFDRKNYFYPDLAKGYQISQYDDPFAINGKITLDSEKEIRIRRVHMEEDTGKLIHEGNSSLIDFNRSGVPLVEIVTEPDFENSEQVVEYLKKLQQIVRYLNVSNADMEKGDMRLEPNVSLRVCHPELDSGSHEMPKQVRHDNDGLPNYKVEVKNINSFRFVEKAIEYEIKRQTELLDQNQTPAQETRGWDENKQKTVSQRSKEEAHDYRYFPEPDIPPIRFDKSQITNLKSQMPELPDEKRTRFEKDYQLLSYDAEILTRERATADYFENAVKAGQKTNITPKQIANVIINKKVDINTTNPTQLVQEINKQSQKIGVSQEELERILKELIHNNPNVINDYKKLGDKVLGFFVGELRRKLGTNVDIVRIKATIDKLLKLQ